MNRLWTVLSWGTWILFALLPGALLSPNLFESLLPFSDGSLQAPDTIDLKALRPHESRTVSVEIRNQSRRCLPLHPVRTDCGCIRIDHAPIRISAGGTATLRMTITAPAAPGHFSQTVLIVPRHAERLARKLVVKGRVAARVWSEPNELQLTTAAAAPIEAKVNIRHDGSLRIGEILPSSNAVQVTKRVTRQNRVHVEFQVRPEKSEAILGKAALHVYSTEISDEPVLEIPIQWNPASSIGYAPFRMELADFDAERGVPEYVSRVVAITVPPDRSATEAEVASLVPWARIVERTCHGSVLRVQVNFDRDKMPNEFHQAILSARLPEDPIDHKLIASGQRIRNP